MSSFTDPEGSREQAPDEDTAMMTRLLAAAQPGAVYSPPVVAGAYTVITASEVITGGGFGFGKGGNGQAAMGSGAGGGGGSVGRPVAVIAIGPNGVQISPIDDVTKIVLTGLSAWGSIVGLLARLRKARQ